MNATSRRKLDPEAARRATRLRRQVGQAIADFNMIEDGDRVMVCVSGGKDSWTLLDLLLELQANAPIAFELVAVHLDQKQPGYDAEVIPRYLRERDVTFHVLEQDTYGVVKRVIPEGRTMCSLCSRLRRGALYTFAAEQGLSKIALGHHRDDIVETLFLNLFHQATLKAMPPKLRSDDGRNIVIRPLAYCSEHDIAEHARAQAFPILPCNLCGSQENLQRKAIKSMLAAWESQHPGRIENIFRALGHTVPSHLLDHALHDFAALGRRAQAPRTDAHGGLADPD
ncbi:MAG TPA: tRNA 2-thiocytidine(32) synthetase TtcA [Dokdonella sp.]